MALDITNNGIAGTEPAGTEPNNQGTEPNSQAKSGDDNTNKTFTQDEVDRIVQERLARERKNTGNNEDLTARVEELNKRENRLKCAEMLQEKGLQKDLLDILDTSDIDKFTENIGKLENMGAIRGKGSKPIPYIVGPTPGPLPDVGETEDDRLKQAFGL